MTASTDIPKYYSTAQVAEMFEVKPSTVRGWVRDGHISAIRLPGKSAHLRISHEELQRYARSRYDIEDTAHVEAEESGTEEA